MDLFRQKPEAIATVLAASLFCFFLGYSCKSTSGPVVVQGRSAASSRAAVEVVAPATLALADSLVASTKTESSALSKRAVENAIVAKTAGKLEEYAACLRNALGHDPGNSDAIRAVASELIDAADERRSAGDFVDALQQLDRATEFLDSRVPFLLPSEISTINSITLRVEEKRQIYRAMVSKAAPLNPYLNRALASIRTILPSGSRSASAKTSSYEPLAPKFRSAVEEFTKSIDPTQAERALDGYVVFQQVIRELAVEGSPASEEFASVQVFVDSKVLEIQLAPVLSRLTALNGDVTAYEAAPDEFPTPDGALAALIQKVDDCHPEISRTTQLIAGHAVPTIREKLGLAIKLSQRLALRRARRYSLWSIRIVQEAHAAYSQSYSSVPLRTKKEPIRAALLSSLSQIDTRYLDAATANLYHSVLNECLVVFDLDERIQVVRGMASAQRVDLEQF